jgi:hypothetical protein
VPGLKPADENDFTAWTMYCYTTLAQPIGLLL